MFPILELPMQMQMVFYSWIANLEAMLLTALLQQVMRVHILPLERMILILKLEIGTVIGVFTTMDPETFTLHTLRYPNHPLT